VNLELSGPPVPLTRSVGHLAPPRAGSKQHRAAMQANQTSVSPRAHMRAYTILSTIPFANLRYTLCQSPLYLLPTSSLPVITAPSDLHMQHTHTYTERERPHTRSCSNRHKHTHTGGRRRRRSSADEYGRPHVLNPIRERERGELDFRYCRLVI